MSDSPPSRARAMQSRPTMSDGSVWKNWLHKISSHSHKVEYEYSLPCIRPIYPYFIRLFCILSQILDVAQDMTPPILADEVAKIGAQSHVCNRGLLIAPLLHRKPLE